MRKNSIASFVPDGRRYSPCFLPRYKNKDKRQNPQKKNQPGLEQIRLNEALADKYNSEGSFPLTLLVDAKGKVLKKWDGFPNLSPGVFVDQIDDIVNEIK